jgi:hypothetical protein
VGNVSALTRFIDNEQAKRRTLLRKPPLPTGLLINRWASPTKIGEIYRIWFPAMLLPAKFLTAQVEIIQ